MNKEFADFDFTPTMNFGEGLNSKSESHLQASKASSSDADKRFAGQDDLGIGKEVLPTFEIPLLGMKPPMYVNQEEKPQHRVALELAAKGFAIKEIAEMTGYSMPAIGYWLKQKDAVTLLTSEIRRIHGEDEQVVQIIKENVVHAVNTLAGIMRNPDARGSDRIAAAEKLLERRYGKANQPINRGTDVDLNSLSDSELAKMLPTEGTGTT